MAHLGTRIFKDLAKKNNERLDYIVGLELQY